MNKAATVTIDARRKGEKAIHFKEGALHRSTGTKSGKKISGEKHEEARSGKFGKKAEKQEIFRENVLTGRKGKKTKKKKRGGGKK